MITILRKELADYFTSIRCFILFILVILASAAGIYAAYRFYMKEPHLPDTLARRYSIPYNILLNKYYVDEIYQAAIVNPLARFSEGLWRFFDVGVIDGIINGIGQFFLRFAAEIRRIQTGYIHHYALSVLLGACALFVYVLIQ